MCGNDCLEARLRRLLCGMSLVLCCIAGAGADVLTVGPSGDYATIQAALDAATHGDEIVVSPGTYAENIRFNGKNVILRSTDPTDPSIVESVVIDGAGTTSVVTFDGTEGTTCQLSGFKITGGRSPNGGGVSGNGARAAIRHNIVTGNVAERDGAETGFGGGLFDCDGLVEDNTIGNNTIEGVGYGYGAGLSGCDGTIRRNTIADNFINLTGSVYGSSGGGLYQCGALIHDNTITANTARSGGGLYGCSGAIRRNTIQDNVATGASYSSGGGLFDCDGPIQGNLITGNTATSGGGGVYGCDGVILSNTIVHNTAADGAGMRECDGVILNNTIAHNDAIDGPGGGLGTCYGFVANCVIWENTATEDPWAGGPGGQNFSDTTIPIYSCISDWNGGGAGNISTSPNLSDDYHLQPGSTAIDAGATFYLMGDFIADVDGESRLAGASVDMGCDETGSSADSDGDLLADEDEAAAGGQADKADTDGDGLIDGAEVLRGTLPNTPDTPSGIQVPADRPSVQQAIFLAFDGETVTLAAATTYTENLHFQGKNIALQGTNPLDPGVVASTVIDGDRTGSVITLLGTEDDTAAIRGLTLLNALSVWSGGISGHGALATIEYNRILDNEAEWGGGIGYCDGLVQWNTISGNYASFTGGGLANCGGTIKSNDISGNRSYHGSGGVFRCHGYIQNNRIQGNRSVSGPAAMEECDGTVCNNLIVQNESLTDNGGLEDCNGLIMNNTIADNTCQDGPGAFYRCEGTIMNNLVWGNSNYAFSSSATPWYCCVDESVSGGRGNFQADPKFVDRAAGDYRLMVDSPCVDAGYTWYFRPKYTVDIEGECRVTGGVVDVGCDEVGSSPDTDGDLLSDADEALYQSDPNMFDSDGDGLFDGAEVIRGAQPDVFDTPVTVTVPLQFPLIQQAVFLAYPGEIVRVGPGKYEENVRFLGKNVALQSHWPSRSHAVRDTTIDGGGFAAVVGFDGTEDETCSLRGFRIQNGSGVHGGGVRGAGALAAIEGNWITRNTASQVGGGVYDCDGPIRNNILSRNEAPDGAALYGCDGVICNNTIYGNVASRNSGAVEQCEATLLMNCILWGNDGDEQIVDSTEPAYCCVEDWSGGGEGNISADPAFRNAFGGNFSLTWSSSCVDAGATTTLAVDFDGDLRPLDRSGEPRGDGSDMDIGADEYGGRDLAAQIVRYLLGLVLEQPEEAGYFDINRDGIVDMLDVARLLR